MSSVTSIRKRESYDGEIFAQTPVLKTGAKPLQAVLSLAQFHANRPSRSYTSKYCDISKILVRLHDMCLF